MCNAPSADLQAASELLARTSQKLCELILVDQRARGMPDDIVVAYHCYRIASESFDRMARDYVDAILG